MNFGYKKMYINGQLTDAIDGGKEDIVCPGTDEKISEIAWAGEKDALAALDSAKAGFNYWKKLSIKERNEWISKLRDAVIEKEQVLREAVMYEMGKTYESTAEDFQIIDALDYYPQAMRFHTDTIIPDIENDFRHQFVSQPAGVVVAYLPWNFPLLCLGFKLGPALAAGCSIIIKPSPASPVSAYVFAEICESIGFPKGVINILCGPNEIGKVLSSSKIPAVVTMIGSSNVGRIVTGQSATSIKRYSLELGGNAPALIFPDTNVAQAAADVAALKFGTTGQVCVTPNRVFVHTSIIEEFTKHLIEKAKEVIIGFGKNEQPTMGPVINKRERDRILKVVKDTVTSGAELVYGGNIPQGKEKGAFIEPTILTGVTDEMDIFHNEVFGPVVSIIAFDDEENVLEQANDTEAGLASYVYTKDVDRIERLSEELDFGEVMINGFKWSIYLPHLGIKESGVGADCGTMALEPYLIKKRISRKRAI